LRTFAEGVAMKVGIASLLLAVVLGSSACGGADSTADSEHVGVSFVDYSPKPLSKDMNVVTVRFTTTAPAGPGLEYSAWLFTGEGDDRDQHCYSEFGPPRGVVGAADETYEQQIHLEEDGLQACFGKAVLTVWTQAADEPGGPTELLQEIPLEILPPRPGPWYSPRDRAAQLAEETYRWDGDAPPHNVRCMYTHTDPGRAEWHLCTPGSWHIACSAETTRKPLTGKSDRRNLSWGDCAID
jgi:hypothetical protein